MIQHNFSKVKYLSSTECWEEKREQNKTNKVQQEVINFYNLLGAVSLFVFFSITDFLLWLY